MKKTTRLKLHACSSFNCGDLDCDYCPNCSHAYYKGTARIGGRQHEWEFNPYHGPLFACKALGKDSWLPHHRHEVWKRFEKWYTRYFSNMILTNSGANAELSGGEAVRSKGIVGGSE
ncbi:MAG: hypothetical protein ABIH23_36325 [bacterium]